MVREFRAQGLIPNAVSLTTYGRELEVLHADAHSGTGRQTLSGTRHVQIGKTFHLHQIIEAHRCMEGNKAG
jgi:hypothetical protein